MLGVKLCLLGFLLYLAILALIFLIYAYIRLTIYIIKTFFWK